MLFFTHGFYAAGLLAFGPLTEMAGRKKILIGGFGCSILITVSLAYASPDTFLLLRSFQGFCLGCFAPVAYAYCFETFDERTRTRLISLINMGFLMSDIIGQLISSALAEAFNWAAVFYFFACMYAVVTVVMVFLIEEKKRGTVQKKFFSSLGSILQNKKLLLCYLLTFVMLMSFVAYYEGIHREYGGTVSNEALFWSKAAGLTGVFFSLISVKWILKYGKLTAVRYAMIGMILSFLFTFSSTNLYMSAGLSVLYTASLFVYPRSFHLSANTEAVTGQLPYPSILFCF
ncbi:MFS transporter [Bacillus sp. F19]|nr:MFS transporter [Bacillus sp. F19]